LIGYYKISERNTWLGSKRDELAGSWLEVLDLI